jgi:hypothetical protein
MNIGLRFSFEQVVYVLAGDYVDEKVCRTCGTRLGRRYRYSVWKTEIKDNVSILLLPNQTPHINYWVWGADRPADMTDKNEHEDRFDEFKDMVKEEEIFETAEDAQTVCATLNQFMELDEE